MTGVEETLDDYRQAIAPVKQRYPGVRILMAFGEDWGGEPSVFLTVVFPDDDLPNDQWGDRAAELTRGLSAAIFEKGLGRFPYYEVHSQETFSTRGSNWPSSIE
ncbi:MAG: hypothetical protein NTZ56_19855 [Acidobacteria bacterium]|nr:hypothetical protein [Acidobacteriota bacterium]